MLKDRAFENVLLMTIAEDKFEIQNANYGWNRGEHFRSGALVSKPALELATISRLQVRVHYRKFARRGPKYLISPIDRLVHERV
ncbi:hypothetical protein PoB_002606900 [Plakobranchus ocellatus]|uniref:Uncharacterized protein n=1 Tax=Plakobranchus ocellatus TaxID=259542 RepID=A0AAV4A030_9GAST|nr:hypothetical protein PoB_002606900 [Plakobranchus ocellatus]